jgi:hypothetical protein
MPHRVRTIQQGPKTAREHDLAGERPRASFFGPVRWVLAALGVQKMFGGLGGIDLAATVTAFEMMDFRAGRAERAGGGTQ